MDLSSLQNWLIGPPARLVYFVLSVTVAVAAIVQLEMLYRVKKIGGTRKVPDNLIRGLKMTVGCAVSTFFIYLTLPYGLTATLPFVLAFRVRDAMGYSGAMLTIFGVWEVYYPRAFRSLLERTGVMEKAPMILPPAPTDKHQQLHFERLPPVEKGPSTWG